MKPDELQKNLRQLNNFDLALTLAFVALRWLRHRSLSLRERVRVRDLALPAAVCQVILFIAAGSSSNPLVTLAVGNLILTAIVLLPMTSSPKYSRSSPEGVQRYFWEVPKAEGDGVRAHWIQ